MSDIIKNIIANIMHIPIEKVNNDSGSKNIETWDSLRHMKLVLALEEEFNIMFSDDEIIEITSLKKLIEILQLRGIKNV